MINPKKLDSFQIEKMENEYLNSIFRVLVDNLDTMIGLLNSRIKIKNNWFREFESTKPGKNYSDLNLGAERIFNYIYSRIMTNPNSSPIGSDLMYETYDSFIHIDIKTALLTNQSDYKGKINIGNNQTSYPSKKYKFKPNLHPFYSITYEIEGNTYYKPCLTYAIMVIHEHGEELIYGIYLISIPNGILYEIYNEKIVNAGKSGTGGTNIRYNFGINPKFDVLTDKYQEENYRIKIIFNDEYSTIKDLTNIESIPNYIIIRQ
jgi:hypothetical protein